MESLNPRTLQTFQSLMGPAELAEFFTYAHQELSSAGERLRQMQSDQNWAGVRAQIHRLKGTMGSLGCDALYTALNALDDRLKSHPEAILSDEDMRWVDQLILQSLQALAQHAG